jgi:hypothetical protein
MTFLFPPFKRGARGNHNFGNYQLIESSRDLKFSVKIRALSTINYLWHFYLIFKVQMSPVTRMLLNLLSLIWRITR